MQILENTTQSFLVPLHYAYTKEYYIRIGNILNQTENNYDFLYICGEIITQDVMHEQK